MKKLEIRKIKTYDCPECYTRYDSEIEAYRCCIDLQTAEAYVVTNENGDRLSRARWYDIGDAVSEYLQRTNGVAASFKGSVKVNINFKDKE